MKKLSQGVSAIFKVNDEQFSPERRQELLEVIAANGKVKNKELLDIFRRFFDDYRSGKEPEAKE